MIGAATTIVWEAWRKKMRRTASRLHRGFTAVFPCQPTESRSLR